MKYLCLFLCCLIAGTATAQTGIAVPSMHAADSLIQAFMGRWNIDGGAVAITKDGKLIYNRGFGYADQDSGETAYPYHLYRIASVSKPITSIAIMKLIENGQLLLDDTVFGAGRILNDNYYLSVITDSRIYDITVRQLLEHTAGWDRDMPCDGYPSCDPIGFPLHVTSQFGEPNPVGDSTLIKFLLQKGLNNAPGAVYAYSNIGYLVLGKIIEKKTGMKYEQYLNSILSPLGICDMHLGKNLLQDKQEREGEYNSPYTTQSCYGTGTTVPWQYGGWNLEAMNAHGGWIATASDLTRLILAVDGFPTVPDILTSASIVTMRTPSAANPYYAKGWSVNPSDNWWHTGSLDGTSSFICRSAGGYTWAFLFNLRGDVNAFWTELDQLPWSCLAATASFPTHNLFPPSSQASGLTASITGSTKVNLQWTPGSGDGRLVVATEATAWTQFPVDGTSYTANAAYGQGQALGSNAYVVYAGNGSSVAVSGLDPTKTYRFAVYEYASNSTTGNNTVYKYGCRSDAIANMTITSVAGMPGGGGWQLYPNPAGNEVSLRCDLPALYNTRGLITDMTGSTVKAFVIKPGLQTVSLQQLTPGVYTLHLANGGAVKLVRY